MNDEPLELIHGSGNVFADFGYPNADVEQLKALLAAEIIGVLDDRTFRSKVSAQDCDAAVGSDGLVSRTDDILSCDGDSVALVELLEPFLAALIESVLF